MERCCPDKSTRTCVRAGGVRVCVCVCGEYDNTTKSAHSERKNELAKQPHSRVPHRIQTSIQSFVRATPAAVSAAVPVCVPVECARVCGGAITPAHRIWAVGGAGVMFEYRTRVRAIIIDASPTPAPPTPASCTGVYVLRNI